MIVCFEKLRHNDPILCTYFYCSYQECHMKSCLDKDKSWFPMCYYCTNKKIWISIDAKIEIAISYWSSFFTFSMNQGINICQLCYCKILFHLPGSG